jgi:Bacteriophage T4-like portal protein (Gp20)/Intein splicing domain
MAEQTNKRGFLTEVFDRFFGWSVRATPNREDQLVSFTPRETDDGALTVTSGGTYGTYLDLEGSAKTEAELVAKYRDMSIQPECDAAIEDIMSEAIVKEGNEKVVDIELDDLPVVDTVKNAIIQAWNRCADVLDINGAAYEIFRRWYIDGRLYYNAMIDPQNPRLGLQEMRYCDPRKIRKIRVLKRVRQDGIYVTKVDTEYYLYNERGFKGASVTGLDNQGLKITNDSVINVTSGLVDKDSKLVLGFLHKAIKPLNQLRIMEDATVVYRISRAPERRIFKLDVGNMSKMRSEQYVRDMMVQHKNRLIYDATTGSVRDDRKFMCYALDTLIPLLDGRTLSLKDIISEYEAGKTNWVYSCNPTTGKFVPGPVSWAGITKKNTRVVRVTLDNGKSLTCTPDHKFPVWDKGFIEAKDLAVGESIIPGYRRMKAITSGGNEYEQIYKNEAGTWEYTHREVSRWKDEVGMSNEFTFANPTERKTVIHHLDHNRMNNNPDNIGMMGHQDHRDYHLMTQSIEYTDDIGLLVNLCAKIGASAREAIDTVNELADLDAWRVLNKYRHVKQRDCEALKFNNNDLIRICRKIGCDGWRDLKKLYDVRIREANGRIQRGARKGSLEYSQKLSKIFKGRIRSRVKTWKVTSPSGEPVIVENLNEFCRQKGLNRSNIKHEHGSRGYHAEVLHNHKVVSVEWLEDLIDTGCLTVDKNETYHSNHTYLLDAGVYTKNTMIEDYWFPTRDGGKGTTIETLPAGQNLGVMEDVRYFEEKLYRSLSVPVSHLLPETGFSLGRSSEITRDELKFQKFIMRLRTRFSQLFYKTLEKQLLLTGICTTEDWREWEGKIHFKFSKDNFFAELKNEEIIRERVNTLNLVQPYVGMYYSMNWVKKNILQLSEEDTIQMDREMEEERELMAEIAMAQDPQLAMQQQELDMQSQQMGTGSKKKKGGSTKEGAKDKKASKKT